MSGWACGCGRGWGSAGRGAGGRVGGGWVAGCRGGVPWSTMAAILVIARLCEPSSELHIAEDWYRRTALSDLLQLEDDQVNKDRLYRALDHLILHKKALEAHLSRRC